MVAPGTSSGSVEASSFASETQTASNPANPVGVNGGATTRRDEFYGLNRAFYIAAAVACIGFLVILFGTYAIPNPATVVAGTLIAALAAIAWIILASIMIAFMAKSLFRGRGKTPSPRPPRPEKPRALS